MLQYSCPETRAKLFHEYAIFCPWHGMDYTIKDASYIRACQREDTEFGWKYWNGIGECADCAKAQKAFTFWAKLHNAIQPKSPHAQTIEYYPYNPVEPHESAAERDELQRRHTRAQTNRSSVIETLYNAELIGRLHSQAINSEHGQMGPGRPVQFEIDEIIRCLALDFRHAGGEPKASISNDAMAEPKKPFARFLFHIWPLLPRNIRLMRAVQFVDRAREVLAFRRNDEAGLVGSTGQTPIVTLRVIAPVEIGGRQPGEQFQIPVKDGQIWDEYWRKRHKEEAVEIVRK